MILYMLSRLHRLAAAGLLSVSLSVAIALRAASAPATHPLKPNLIIILADDMGFSDVGCYGGEIPTPNIDALAAAGLRFTQFYNTARCSPTRASLLTGLHPHSAGMGTLAEDPGKRSPANAAAGYQQYLNDRCATLAEILRPEGYKSYISGKWHLGYFGEEKWPLQRGFDRFYGIISGASSYFTPKEPRGLTLDNRPLPTPDSPEFYTTDAFTDYALKFMAEHRDGAPFFLYLAYTAPHWPLHARSDDIAKFAGRYKGGWDKLRTERFVRQRELGVVPAGAKLSPRDEGARAWDSFNDEEKNRLDYRMAIYAAQVHRMDWNIGRLVKFIRDHGKLENTLIMFLSDNGGCAEPYTDIGGGDFSVVNMPSATGSGGKAAPFGGSSYGTGWANASNTPFRRYKSRLHQGGIATPLVVHWPAGLATRPGALTNAPGYLVDIMPTVLEITGAKYPSEKAGVKLSPLPGHSLAPIFSEGTRVAPEYFFWEQYDNKAVRRGDWKAVQNAEPGSAWELYDLAHDHTELKDLAGAEPARLAELTAAWLRWAESHQVYPKHR
jgi:arylsulfatase A-like enzyme